MTRGSATVTRPLLGLLPHLPSSSLTADPSRTKMQQHHGIFNLPPEILEAIFVFYVRAWGCPRTLSAVCAEWRAVAHHCGVLWTWIQLSTPNRAKHNFALSGMAPLTVDWSDLDIEDDSDGLAILESRDWIWDHADRFAHLKLWGPAIIAEHVLCQLDEVLPILKAMSVTALRIYNEDGTVKGSGSNVDEEDLENSFYAQIRIDFRCPVLQNLDLE